MLIYSTYNSPRLNYVLQLIFTQHLGITFTLTNDLQYFENANVPKLAYANTNNVNYLQIIPHPFLELSTVEKQHFDTVLHNNVKCPYATKGVSILPFDVFAATFYLITRYEEYLPHKQNKYEQFVAKQSYAYKNDFLKKPQIDIWVQELKAIIQNKYPQVQFLQKKFTLVITYDIDTAFAYRGRKAIHHIAAFGKDLLTLNFSNFIQRAKVMFANKKDPYNTYSAIIGYAKHFNYKPILFFLVGKPNKYNKNIPTNTTIFSTLIVKLANRVVVGIHPSYYAYNNKLLLLQELENLQQFVPEPIVNSRQHYLRLSMPSTYEQLIAANITNDYTMGYAEQPGFRASTCKPYYFYNLLTNKATALVLHPITFMEGTFADDLKLTPTKALPIMSQLLSEVQQVQGQFVCIWHNHTISNYGIWKGWEHIHNQIIKLAHT